MPILARLPIQRRYAERRIGRARTRSLARRPCAAYRLRFAHHFAGGRVHAEWISPNTLTRIYRFSINSVDDSHRIDLSFCDKETHMTSRDRLTETASIVVRFGRVLNRLFLAAVSIALVLSLVLAEPFVSFLAQSRPGVDAVSEAMGLRLEMAIGILAAIATDRLLAALRDILTSARIGDPFIADNAARLQAMGWALLALQLLDIPAALLGRFVPSLGSAAPSGDISLGGWMAVLLLFVLSRVFATGAVMRDELEGTI
jgi:hypothetical protein